MGWQDRDYAREPAPRSQWRGSVRSRGGGSRSRSIVTILIAINVGVFILGGLLSPRVFPPRPDPLFYWGAMSTELVLHGQIWRLFSSQYLHAGTTHILLNMLGLYFFGRPVERIWGRKKFFAVYTIAGLAGNVFLMLIGLIGWIDPALPAVGASGCILGLLGICAVLFPHAEVYVYFLFPVKIRTVAIVLALGYAYKIWQQGSNYGGDACHLAGLAFGVWFAKRGELWWATRGSRWWSRLLGEARVPGPARKGAWERRVGQRRADAELIDKLLAKVYEGGVQSLTPAERKALTEASERQRQEEERVGRTDRL